MATVMRSKIMDKLFRSLVLTSNALYVLWYFQPYNNEFLFEPEVLVALSWIGFGSIELANTVSTLVIGPFFLVVAVGLWFYISYARTAYALLIITNLALAPFIGLSVQTGIDMLISQLVIGMDGAILYMSYFSSVADNFSYNEQG
jgi:hypothetical protein